jgi:hypothetical protein
MVQRDEMGQSMTLLELHKLWKCWVLNPGRKKPYWETWLRLLSRYRVINDGTECEPYYAIYRARIENGQYRAEPPPRGSWSQGKWVLREKVNR